MTHRKSEPYECLAKVARRFAALQQVCVVCLLKDLKDREAKADQRQRRSNDRHQRSIGAHPRTLERHSGAARRQLGRDSVEAVVVHVRDGKVVRVRRCAIPDLELQGILEIEVGGRAGIEVHQHGGGAGVQTPPSRREQIHERADARAKGFDY